MVDGVHAGEGDLLKGFCSYERNERRFERICHYDHLLLLPLVL